MGVFSVYASVSGVLGAYLPGTLFPYELQSKLLKGGYTGDYIGYYYNGY